MRPHHHRPRQTQPQVHPPAPPHQHPPRAGQKDAIEGDGDDRGGGHRLLDPHAQGADDDRPGIPWPPSPPGLRAADNRENRPQSAQSRQRFHPLHDVRHALRLKGMHRPQQGRRPRGPRRRAPQPLRPPLVAERPPQQRKQAQRGPGVDSQVHGMPAPGVETVKGVVEGKGEVGDGPGVGAKPFAGRPEGADGLVLDDGVPVVEDETPLEAVGVGGEEGDEDSQHAQARGEPPRRGRFGRRTPPPRPLRRLPDCTRVGHKRPDRITPSSCTPRSASRRSRPRRDPPACSPPRCGRGRRSTTIR